jgi:hypothetical protein
MVTDTLTGFGYWLITVYYLAAGQYLTVRGCAPFTTEANRIRILFLYLNIVI